MRRQTSQLLLHPLVFGIGHDTQRKSPVPLALLATASLKLHLLVLGSARWRRCCALVAGLVGLESAAASPIKSSTNRSKPSGDSATCRTQSTTTSGEYASVRHSPTRGPTFSSERTCLLTAASPLSAGPVASWRRAADSTSGRAAPCGLPTAKSTTTRLALGPMSTMLRGASACAPLA